jgi:hypothetical protein
MIDPKMMKFIRIFLLVLIIIGIGLLATQKSWVPKVTEYLLRNETITVDTKTGSRWTNKITKARTDCTFDGICSLTIGGVEVVVSGGDRMPPEGGMGKITGEYANLPLEKLVGKTASVYARKINNNLFTLEGNSEFFIEIK